MNWSDLTNREQGLRYQVVAEIAHRKDQGEADEADELLWEICRDDPRAFRAYASAKGRDLTLGPAQLKALRAAANEIGGHTRTHPDITTLGERNEGGD